MSKEKVPSLSPTMLLLLHRNVPRLACTYCPVLTLNNIQLLSFWFCPRCVRALSTFPGHEYNLYEELRCGAQIACVGSGRCVHNKRSLSCASECVSAKKAHTKIKASHMWSSFRMLAFSSWLLTKKQFYPTEEQT